MNYSGPASLADVKADLLLSDEDDIADRHWPPLESHTQHAGPSPWHQPAPRASTSKRSMDQTSDTSDSPSPAPKVSRHADKTHSSVPDSSPIPAINRAPTAAFAPRKHSPQPAPDTSKWKCPRCHEPGVNVWHGCMRRSRTATCLAANMPPLPPPPPPSQRRSPAASLPPASPPTDSPQVLALREAVTNLTARCTAITARFDTIETRIDNLVTQHATTERTLASLVESHHAVIATVATFSEKMEAIVAKFEKISEQLLKEPPKRTPQDNPKTKGRLH
ncbi:hypothetical protein Pmani_032935 [Petrolisthes manimaculis]|uniref:Uncharacterized protein n=1 Tax=Petrolisthes manimaculis TaxID=1843537 RepID=A0AAE1TTA0_9EUCA|nr:hypothetical protein Pmani_032935 [Petrolisthes manimaculis]